MSVVIQDNFGLAAAKAIDNRYGKVSSGGVTIPYTNTSEALSSIPSVYRHLGLTVCVTDGLSIKEYWFKDNLTTLVPKGGVVAGGKNGLTLDTGDSNIKLGGTIIENTTIANSSGNNLFFNFTDASRYAQVRIDKFNPYMQAGDLPNAITDPGSKSRIIVFKSSTALWTNNYSSYAYNADVRWTNAHPWAPANSGNAYGFQIFDNLVATNLNSAFIAHYYDERVGNPNWQDTYTSSVGFPGWTAGKTYTLVDKKGGDNFPGTMASSTVSGTANTSGWIFVSNGNPPLNWTNGSTVDGDYPIIKVDEKYSSVACELAVSGEFNGMGVVNVKGNSLTANCLFDQRNSSRGVIVAQYTTANRPAANDVQQGELFYNLDTNLFEYSDGVSVWYKITSTTV